MHLDQIKKKDLQVYSRSYGVMNFGRMWFNMAQRFLGTLVCHDCRHSSPWGQPLASWRPWDLLAAGSYEWTEIPRTKLHSCSDSTRPIDRQELLWPFRELEYYRVGAKLFRAIFNHLDNRLLRVSDLTTLNYSNLLECSSKIIGFHQPRLRMLSDII